MEQIDKILLEVNRVLEIGGYFIFDIPSQKRRSLSQHQTNGWHGANQASLESILKYTKRNWQLVDYHGIAFFPIHRIATNFRKYFRPLDNYFCESKFKEYSSHLIFILKKI